MELPLSFLCGLCLPEARTRLEPPRALFAPVKFAVSKLMRAMVLFLLLTAVLLSLRPRLAHGEPPVWDSGYDLVPVFDQDYITTLARSRRRTRFWSGTYNTLRNDLHGSVHNLFKRFQIQMFTDKPRKRIQALFWLRIVSDGKWRPTPPLTQPVQNSATKNGSIKHPMQVRPPY